MLKELFYITLMNSITLPEFNYGKLHHQNSIVNYINAIGLC